MDLDEAAWELYSLPPGDFTSARNKLADRARADGDAAASKAIRELKKPTLAAWLANQLVRAEEDRVDELVQLGDDLRDAHASRDGDRMRELTSQRISLVRDLGRAARELAKKSGHKVTDTVGDRLAETLDAASVDADAAGLLRTGRLTSALRHVGFGVVDESGEPAEVTPISTARERRATGKKTTKKQAPARKRTQADKRAEERRRKEAREKLERAEAELAEAEEARAQAEAELDANEHHVEDMRTAVERLTDELEKARAELERAEHRTGSLERALTRASRAATTARRRRDALAEE
ncbi:hypothetical protein ACWDWO_16320 [Actinopolymorpha singaporensis]|uniref:Uncharacterized protein n=1 Tax=Actinopolymorpha singaporensis TaxID=117157 RepID=A0A1H1RYN8_9ACTN|nr:hypothetical protein [Actinopolymorpha singaporensis]SDS40706.1 hypothetical protein SAMN04489717_2597 [Actinopolymorpha singaporensis]